MTPFVALWCHRNMFGFGTANLLDPRVLFASDKGGSKSFFVIFDKIWKKQLVKK